MADWFDHRLPTYFFTTFFGNDVCLNKKQDKDLYLNLILYRILFPSFTSFHGSYNTISMILRSKFTSYRNRGFSKFKICYNIEICKRLRYYTNKASKDMMKSSKDLTIKGIRPRWTTKLTQQITFFDNSRIFHLAHCVINPQND